MDAGGLTALYTIIAGFVSRELVQIIKWGLGKVQLIEWPSWVLRLLPLWKLLLALVVAGAVYLVTTKLTDAVAHPLVILVISQIIHELRDAESTARAERNQ